VKFPSLRCDPHNSSRYEDEEKRDLTIFRLPHQCDIGGGNALAKDPHQTADVWADERQPLQPVHDDR
jgi:hypothetical protein